MAQALPLTKLIGLFVKTLAKPLSKRIKHDFGRYETTKQLLINIGQLNHSVTSRLTVWSAGYRVRSITPLEDDVAKKQGAEFVGESLIFLVSGGVMVWEYNRSKEKDKIKQQKKLNEEVQYRNNISNTLLKLEQRITSVEDILQQQVDLLSKIKEQEENKQNDDDDKIQKQQQQQQQTKTITTTGTKSWWNLW